MNKQATCDSQRIQRFLDRTIGDAELSEFESHLSGCDDCRRQLESTVASDQMWSEMRESLRGEHSTASGLLPSDSDATGEDAISSQATVLKLLTPTDDDRMLGRWGTYEVMGVVGTSGMGVVLKALDTALNRYVAIKIMAPHLGASGAARKRFSREAQAAAAVVHDNVIEIYGVAESAGLPYLVMPYVRGPSLQRRLDDEGPLAVAEILRVGMQAAAGLSAAHAQGLVHRDVKPANILLADGIERVKLTDFGLARAADDASLTRTGVIAGTPQYMSPEQARGEPVDQRSDLFSLGSVLYAMCTGRPPFRAETSYGVMRRITDEEPRPIREINPDIPDWLCGIVSKLMAKQPGGRFQSAREVAALLEQCLAHVQQPTTVPLPAVSGARSVPETRSRSHKRLLTGTLAMLTLIGISLFAGYVSTTPPDIAGNWQGEDWGKITLTQTAPGEYSGTYSDTVVKDKGPGKIELKWSRIEHRYNGTWQEGDDDRFGDLSVRRVGDEIRGGLTTDLKSKINPGTPRLGDLVWRPFEAAAGPAGPDFDVHTKGRLQPVDRLNVNGEWELVLQVPDDSLRLIEQAKNEADQRNESVKVLYILATEPMKKLTGTIASIAKADKGNQAEIRVKINKQDIDPANLHEGTVVAAKIHCGRRLAEPTKAGDERPSIAARQAAQDGWRLWQAGKLAEAELKFKEAVELDPRDANALNGLGWSQFNGGKPEVAIHAFEEAVKIVPDHPAALNGLGQIYLMQRKYAEAEKYLLKAAPQAPAAWFGLARLYLLQGKFEQAESWAKKLVDSPDCDETGKEMLEAAKTKQLSDALRMMLEPPPAEKGNAVITLSPPKGPTPAFIKNLLEDYRKAIVAYDLGFDSVFPQRKWIFYDPSRLGIYPTRDAWPQVLGHVDTDPEKYHVVADEASFPKNPITGPNAFLVPLDRGLVMENYGTLLFAKGISSSGTVVAKSYASLVCQGPMEGRLNFNSYATALVQGDLPGQITSDSYFDLVVTGKFTGRIYTNSYAMVYLMGGCDGSVTLKHGAKVFIAGRTTRAALDRIQGDGNVFLENSDLPRGEHKIRELNVTVGKTELGKTDDVALSISAGQAMQDGWRLWQAGKLAEAESKFQQSVELDPRDANAWNGLGWSQFNGGKPETAIHAFEQAIKIAPDHPVALNGLGQIYLTQRKYAEAEKFLLKAAPQAPAAWFGLARLYLLQGKFEQAEPWAKKVVESPECDETGKAMLEAAKTKRISDALRETLEPPPADKDEPHAHALHFDQLHYCLPQSDKKMKFMTDNFTISLWLKPDSKGRRGSTVSQYIVNRNFYGRNQMGDFVLRINRISGELDFCLWGYDGEHSDWIFGWDVPETRLHCPLHFDAWNHAVITRYRDNYTMRINGAVAANGQSSSSVSDADNINPFTISGAASQPGVHELFLGDLDDFRIFRRCLSGLEIIALYKSNGSAAFLDGEGRVDFGPLRKAHWNGPLLEGEAKELSESAAADSSPTPEDAQGRVLVYEVELGTSKSAITDDDMDKLLKTMDRRLNAGAEKLALVRKLKDNHIEVVLLRPSEAVRRRVERLLARPGTLEFRILADPEKDKRLVEEASNDLQVSADKTRVTIEMRKALLDKSGKRLAWWVPVRGSLDKECYVPGATVNRRLETTEKVKFDEVLVVADPYNITGEYLTRIEVGANQNDPCINFEFNETGGKLFAKLTGEHLPDVATGKRCRLGVILDDEICATPYVNAAISGCGTITGAFTAEEARDLADAIRAGSLPFRLRLLPSASSAPSTPASSSSLADRKAARDVEMQRAKDRELEAEILHRRALEEKQKEQIRQGASTIPGVIALLELPWQETISDEKLDQAATNLKPVADDAVDEIMRAFNRDNQAFAYRHRAVQLLQRLNTTKARASLLDISLGRSAEGLTSMKEWASAAYIRIAPDPTAIRKLLASDDSSVLGNALRALKGVAVDEELLRRLIELAIFKAEEPNSQSLTRILAADVMAADPSGRFAERKIAAIVAAIGQVAKMPDADKVQKLSLGTNSEVSYWRYLRALVEMRGAEEALRKASGRSEPLVRDLLAIARAQRGDTAALGDMRRIVEDRQAGLRRAWAAEGLAVVGGPDDLPLLKKLVQSDPLERERMTDVGPPDRKNTYFPVRDAARDAIRQIESRQKK
jgi:serine/threonine protein kinase/Flp pilus assembly protein TadD